LTLEKKKDPEKLSDLYIEITNDLSFSKTYFPNRSVKVYLNNLSQKIYTSIYKTRRTGKGKFLKFWNHDLPLIMWESRKELLVSFLIFFMCCLLGAFSSYKDSSFASHILGVGYVEMTDENIANQDPMGVYKDENPFVMTSYIGINNLKVAFLTFGMGILFGVGTGFILVSNGFMLGAFQFFFVAKGLSQESFLTIWMHGTPEISAIVLSGAAGFTMGRGLLFPGTYNRQEAFIVSAKKGITIMLGIVPVIIAAAFIEGFITRLDSAYIAEHVSESFVPFWNVLRFGIIALMLSVIIYYFVIYPFRKFHKVDTSKYLEDFVPESARQEIKIDKIKKNGSIYGDVIKLLGQNFGKILSIGLGAGLAFVALIFAFYGKGIDEIIYLQPALADAGAIGSTPEVLPALLHPAILSYLIVVVFFHHFVYIDDLFSLMDFPWLFVINTLVFSLLSVYGFCYAKVLLKMEEKENLMKLFLKHSATGIVLTALFMTMFFLPTGAPFFLMIFIFPLFLAWLATAILDDTNPFTALGNMFGFWAKNYGKMIGLYFILLVSSFIFFIFINSTVQLVIYEIVGWLVNVEDEVYTIIVSSILSVLIITGMTFTGFLMYFGYSLQYYSQKEIQSASHLLEQIENLGERNSKYEIFSKMA